MRTTLALADDILEELRHLARKRGTSMTRVANETLRAGLARSAAPRRPPPFRQRVFDLGEPRVDLTHALRLAASLEDEEIVREIAGRK